VLPVLVGFLVPTNLRHAPVHPTFLSLYKLPNPIARSLIVPLLPPRSLTVPITLEAFHVCSILTIIPTYFFFFHYPHPQPIHIFLAASEEKLLSVSHSTRTTLAPIHQFFPSHITATAQWQLYSLNQLLAVYWVVAVSAIPNIAPAWYHTCRPTT